jgi:hypothetical protein
MQTGTLKEYAKHRGVAPPYVTQLKKAGRLVMVNLNGRPAVNFEESDRVIQETASHSAAGSGKNSPPRSAARVAAGEADQPSAALQSPAAVGDSMYRRAQTQEKLYQARMAENAYRKEMGELLDRAHVDRVVFDLFRALRDQTFQAPQRAALRVRGQADVLVIEQVIAEELRKAFDTWEEKMTARLAPPPRARA